MEGENCRGKESIFTIIHRKRMMSMGLKIVDCARELVFASSLSMVARIVPLVKEWAKTN
jgi:hypothetical protein